MQQQFAAGAHICQLYENFDDLKRVTLPFFTEGLDLGERCCLATTEARADEWYAELDAYGVDVDRALSRGALRVSTGRTWEDPDSFNSIVRSVRVWDYIERSLIHFSGVRFATDVDWEAEPGLGADKVTHWEATANLLFEGVNARAICQYNLTESAPDAILAALRTHPTVLWNGKRYENPFFEAEQILALEPDFNRGYANPRLIQEMLSRLKEVD